MPASLVSRSTTPLARVLAALCALVAVAALIAAPSAHAQAAEPPTCLGPLSDSFDGTELDKQRWSSIVREDTSGYRLADGALKIDTGAGEIQETDINAGAPNLILQPIPQGSWTVTTKVDIAHTPGQAGEGQQAGLLLAGEGAQDVVKVAFVNKGADGRWIEFLKIVDGQYDFSGTWSTPHFPADFPSEVWLRLKSDGQVLSGEYSTDGETWTAIADPRNYEAIENPSIGVYALRGAAEKPVVTASFDRFDLVPTNDEFDGTELDPCRWTVLNENTDGYTLADGQLTLQTLRGELSNDESTVQNMLLQPAGDSDWQAETKLTIDPASTGQQGGLVVRGDESNHAKIVLVRKENGQRWIEFLRTTDGSTDFGGTWNSGYQDFPETVYLRLVSAGGSLSGFYSTDGETWTKVGDSRSIAGIESPQVGLMALGGENDNPPVDATFDYFHLGANEAAPAPECADPAAPESGFTALWDGKTLDGWEHSGPGSFEIVDDGAEGCRLVSRGGLGLLWYAGKTFDEFVLRTQWKAAEDADNSGIFVRFPNTGNVFETAINEGHEIQIREGTADDIEPQKTGSIYNFDREDARNANPAGEWNDYEIRYEDGTYTVTLNGEVVNTWENDGEQGVDPGYIGLQNHSDSDEVSFRNIRIQELGETGEPGDPVNIFTTIGITDEANKQNGQIRGGWTLPAEEMPPSRLVSTPEDDDADDVPVRMPNTSGTVANLAEFRGQTLSLREEDQGAYSGVHFFGTTTDGSGGGDFTLRYSDGTFQTVNVFFPDWCQMGSGDGYHTAIGPLSHRHTLTGQDGAPCGIFHVPASADPAKTLVSVTLPPTTDGSGSNARSYLMALTLETEGGDFVTPDLGASPFPDDLESPTSSHAVSPADPTGENGWYLEPVEVTLEATDGEDEDASGLARVEYSIDGDAFQEYEAGSVITVSGDGRHTVRYRAIDRAGNTETPNSVEINIDGTPPTAVGSLQPERAAPSGWYDKPVELTIRGRDGAGSCAEEIEYRIGDGAWQGYDGPVAFAQPGTYSVTFRATDVAGNAGTAGEPVTFKVDGEAPVTSALVNGAAPAQSYPGAVSVTLGAADGNGSGVTTTEYRVDQGAWTPYGGAFGVAGDGVHIVDFRSRDAAGNQENAREIVFRIGAATQPGGGGGTPGGDPGTEPAPLPDPWARVVKPSRKGATSNRLRRGKLRVGVRCLAVERGVIRLRVSRRVARKLGLKSRTLVRKRFSCQDDGRVNVRLKPSRKVRRALRRHPRRSFNATLNVRMVGETGTADDRQKVRIRGKRGRR